VIANMRCTSTFVLLRVVVLTVFAFPDAIINEKSMVPDPRDQSRSATCRQCGYCGLGGLHWLRGIRAGCGGHEMFNFHNVDVFDGFGSWQWLQQGLVGEFLCRRGTNQLEWLLGTFRRH